METKWTPGPWEIGEISSPPHDRGVFGPDAMVVAKIYVPLNFDKKQADANAKLIAKAPELVEQLSLLLRVMADWRENGKPDLCAFLESYKGAERVLREAGAID